MNRLSRAIPVCFMLCLILLPFSMAEGFEPKRGNKVPSDVGTKIHPFIEQLTFQSTFRSAKIVGIDGKEIKITFTHHGDKIRRTIPPSYNPLAVETLEKGDQIIVKWSGTLEEGRLLLMNHDRRGKFLILLGGSLIICLIVGGWITFRATAGMLAGITFFLYWSVPQIQAGSPILWEIMLFYTGVTLMILPASLGWNRKAVAAVAAALTTGLVSVGLLELTARWIGVVGLRDETLQVIEFAVRYFPSRVAELSIPSIVVGATMIGALGVILDVCVDVTSSAAEINRARPDLPFRELLSRTLTVSSRLVGTMTNTLLLAYVGTDLFLLLTIYILPTPTWITLNQDFVAMEVLRGLGGALGFLGAVPLSVFFYWLLFGQTDREPTPPAAPD